MSLSALGSWRQALIAPRQIDEHWPTYHYRFVHAERLCDEVVVQKTTAVSSRSRDWSEGLRHFQSP